MIKTKIFEEILKVVSEVMKVSGDDILSPKRDREIAEARQVFVWFCKVNGGCAKDIIKYINRKDKNCVTELVNNYHSNYASYTMYRIMSDKISRILPPILKKVEDEEKARDLAEIMENFTANSTPNETTK